MDCVCDGGDGGDDDANDDGDCDGDGDVFVEYELLMIRRGQGASVRGPPRGQGQAKSCARGCGARLWTSALVCCARPTPHEARSYSASAPTTTSTSTKNV